MKKNRRFQGFFDAFFLIPPHAHSSLFKKKTRLTRREHASSPNPTVSHRKVDGFDDFVVLFSIPPHASITLAKKKHAQRSALFLA